MDYNEEMRERVSAALVQLRAVEGFESRSVSRATMAGPTVRLWPAVRLHCHAGHHIDALQLLINADGTWQWSREPREGIAAVVSASPGERKEWWEGQRSLEGRILFACPRPKCKKKPLRKEDELLRLYAAAVIAGKNKVILE